MLLPENVSLRKNEIKSWDKKKHIYAWQTDFITMCDILTLFTLGRYWLWKQQTSPVFLLSLSHEMIWPILNIAPFFYIKDDEKKTKTQRVINQGLRTFQAILNKMICNKI